MSAVATVLLQQGAADWEFGPVLPVLRYYLGLEIRTATPDGHAIETIGGLRVQADTIFETANIVDADIVMIVGSDVWQPQGDSALEKRLKARADAGRPIAAICAGTLPLARAGVLDGRPHTSNALGFLKENAAEYHGEAHYRDVAHAVSDGVIVTAPGSAPASFACAVAAAVKPERAAEVVAYWNMARGEFEALGTDLEKVFRA
ncbi:DJ-1/PfpI family protein [Caulobacter sp. 17J80-11]|uniref:DJ-1/PfpI family protein n=1 Tax=Caulobacter sp. 17J80-11 TaxID=2763502 RepID=UPI001653B14B|nr:DJ-1/PfpI family protein [Caulobacter sp. 17J80-11]MBC6981970.1 DJ-1/PfpI family protein [Caulobacter sp. 17J80-11]